MMLILPVTHNTNLNWMQNKYTKVIYVDESECSY